MSEYLTYLDGGKTNAEGLYKYLNRLFTAGVPTFYAATSLQVSQRGAGANMSVDVAIGDVMLTMPTNAYSLWGYTDAVKNVTVTAADVSNPRIDALVVYGDVTAFSATSNNPGALKFKSVTGTATGSPVAPNAAAIQTSIGGSSIPYQILAYIAVGTGVTTITTGNCTDARTGIKPQFPTSTASTTIPYKFSVYRNASQTVTASTDTRINFDTENFDTGNNYDNVTNFRFTAPVAGVYFLTANVTNNGSGIFFVKFYKNGSPIRYGNNLNPGSNLSGGSVTDLLSLAANDYIEVWVNTANTGINGIISGQQTTYFSGYLIGQ